MSQLILTEKEKAAATWLELPDATVGQLVKHTAIKILEADDEMGRVGYMSAALILTGMAGKANSATTTFTLKGTTFQDEPTGDWQITIKRLKK
jgi:hypothetical protein